MPIVEFKPQTPTKEQQIADYFAEQEIKDFKDMYAIFREQCQLSYLFKDLDFKAIYEGIVNNVKAKHFDANGKLSVKAEQEIYGFYRARVPNLNEIYDKHIAKKK